MAALTEALRFIESNPEEEVHLYMDCQSLVECVGQRKVKIGRKESLMRETYLIALALWERLKALGRKLQIIWVPRDVIEARLGH